MEAVPASDPSANAPNFDISQWMLVWMALDESKMVRGKTVFVKQMFVVANEVIPQLKPLFKFYPHRFGPYSKEFESALNGLVDGRFVREILEQEGQGIFSTDARRDYVLLLEGETEAHRLLAQVPQPLKDKLTEYRKLLSRMGYIGLLSYVYSTYPDFTKNSELELA